MRNTLLFATLLALGAASPVEAGVVLHVDDDASPGGDGLTWPTAHRYLQDALLDAAGNPSVSEIRVAQGTYRADEGAGRTPGDRGEAFVLVTGTALTGGYAGHGAPDPDARDPSVFPTILSGDLAEDDGPDLAGTAENSYHVVRVDGPAPGTVLDGFTIRDGNADGDDPLDNRGGGVRLENGSLLVRLCRLVDNEATFNGGGIFSGAADLSFEDGAIEANYAFEGAGLSARSGGTLALSGADVLDNVGTSPVSRGPGVLTACDATIDSCVFTGNVSGIGGALATESGISSLVVTQTDFTANTALGDGGAIRDQYAESVCLDACTFTANEAGGGGGAIIIIGGNLEATGCVFTGNIADDGGGAIKTNSGSTIALTGCDFVQNTAGFGGAVCNDGLVGPITATYTDCTFEFNSQAALYERRSDFVADGCSFTNNEAFGATLTSRGGAIHATDSQGSGRIADCTFVTNFAGVGGGAVYLAVGNARVERCDFSDNGSNREGGAIATLGFAPTINSCRFVGNNSAERGGAAYGSHSTEAVYVNCLFSSNASVRGGAIAAFDGGRPRLVNCTLSLNFAITAGAAVASLGATAEVRVANTVAWGNDIGGVSDEAAQLAVDPGALLLLDYCCVEGWTGAFGGIGNHGGDPLFVDPDGADNVRGTLDDDARLGAGSACIDAGANAGQPADIHDLDGDGVTCERWPLDLDGAPRFADDVAVIDTGCGEPVTVDIGAYEAAGVAQAVTFADVDGDGAVGFADLLALLGGWGPLGAACGADLDLDREIGLGDLLTLLAAWGPCP